MKDNPAHNRRSIRLKGYDYSKSGAYFITICVKDNVHFFGKIENGKMILNDAGRMIDKWWQKIPEKFPDIKLGEYQIMPNHFHAIVLNTGIVRADPSVRPNESKNNAIVRPDPRVRPNESIDNSIVRADPCVRPNESIDNSIVRADPCVRPENEIPNQIIGQTHGSAPTNSVSVPILGEHTGSPLRMVVQWFKTMSTNEYIRCVKTLNWSSFDGKLWHRNYYEHIIRDETSYNNIANYIINNPAKWNEDKFNN
jgi:putative transposase